MPGKAIDRDDRRDTIPPQAIEPIPLLPVPRLKTTGLLCMRDVQRPRQRSPQGMSD